VRCLEQSLRSYGQSFCAPPGARRLGVSFIGVTCAFQLGSFGQAAFQGRRLDAARAALSYRGTGAKPRRAARSHSRQTEVHFRYLDEGGKESRRTVRPLALAFWGKIWSMASWCELRQDFRNFGLDRISEIDLKERFEAEPGKTLDDFIRHVTQHPTQRARDPSAKPVQSS
jgi:predicted DNA-binding transcriptional regulator YafY